MSTSTIKATMTGTFTGTTGGTRTSISETIHKTLRIISKAWEESRVEYKKHAILGGGWE